MALPSAPTVISIKHAAEGQPLCNFWINAGCFSKDSARLLSRCAHTQSTKIAATIAVLTEQRSRIDSPDHALHSKSNTEQVRSIDRWYYRRLQIG